jgi:Crinkler effector protein N-terminal domain
MQSSMADYSPPALTCLIEGESSLFRVKPTTDIDMVDLKELIREKGINATEHAVLAKHLLLWKVRMIMGQRHHN